MPIVVHSEVPSGIVPRPKYSLALQPYSKCSCRVARPGDGGFLVLAVTQRVFKPDGALVVLGFLVQHDLLDPIMVRGCDQDLVHLCLCPCICVGHKPLWDMRKRHASCGLFSFYYKKKDMNPAQFSNKSHQLKSLTWSGPLWLRS